MIKVSVIVPIYNSSLFLKKCLDSLVNQTLNEMEFILINDGSEDNSEEIIKSYSDKRIKYIKQENLGIGKTRNKGITEAKGEYIGFLDSDDYVEPNAYLEMLNEAVKRDLDIVICDYYEEKNNCVKDINLIDFSDTTLNNNPNLLINIPLSPWNKLYKKSLFNKKSFFPEGLKYEDTPFVAYMFSCATKIGKLNKKLFHYVIHEKSQTTIIDNKVFDIFKICDILKNNLGNNLKIKNSLNDLIVYLITKYTISMRVVSDKNIRNKFIDTAFNYLNANVDNFKKTSYFKKRNILKRIIEKNKTLTKIYCNLYVLLNNVK